MAAGSTACWPRVAAIAVALVVSLLKPDTAAAEAAAPEVSVVATLEQYTDQDPILVFHFTNVGRHSFEMFEDQLPWGIQRSLSLALFRLDETGCWKVEEYFLIDDRGSPTIVVDPGVTLTGGVRLSSRFSGLKSPERTADYLVRWRYVPTTADMAKGKSSSGWIIVPAAQSQ